MITNVEALTAHLCDWIKQQAKNSKTTHAVVGLSGGVDSAVVFALCARVLPTVGVRMPCHSSDASMQRAAELFEAVKGVKGVYPVVLQTVDLVDAFDCVAGQVSLSACAGRDQKAANAALRSCLRAPTLDYTAKLFNALVYGTGNRDEDVVFRYYQKRGDGAVDNNVLASLHKSEVWELAEYLGVPQSIIKATPTADLWGEENQTDEEELGMKYSQVEWATRIISILGSEKVLDDIHTMNLSENDRDVLFRAARAEIATRHKAEPPPCPSREELSYYVV